MMIAALLALAAGACAGIFLATRHFLRKRLPASVALLHGLGGATGFSLVLLTVVREPTFRPIRDVLYLLVATVLLGCVNLLFHIRRVRHRTSLIVLHGLTAVSAACMLIRAIVVHAPETEARAAATLTAPGASASAEPGTAPRTADHQPEAVVRPPASGAAAAPPNAGDDPARTPPAKEFAVDESVRRALDRRINFQTKNAEVSHESLSVIADIARTLKGHPELSLIEVQGHADERGDDAQNVELTLARARSVSNALVANGVARERLRSAGYGARCPENPACERSDGPDGCHAPASWERDRRVVLLVLQNGGASFHGAVVCNKGSDLIPPEDRRFHSPAAKH